MAREVWPKEELIAASEDVICLAIHRYDDLEWTQRLGVMGYPKIIFLDPWARPLGSSSSARTASALVYNIQKQKLKSLGKAKRLKIPAKLKKYVTRDLKKDAVNPVLEQRASVWINLLGQGDWTPKELLALFEWEADALVGIAVIQKIEAPSPKDKNVRKILTGALSRINDYVRLAAMKKIAVIGGDEMAELLNGIMLSVLDRASPYSNPNNMLCEAAKLAAEIESPSSVEVLTRILEQETANNSATIYALNALIANGSKHGLDVVRKGLEAGLRVSSVTGFEDRSERLRQKAEKALKDL